MKKFLTTALLIAASVCGCAAQAVVKMPLSQNPLFEVSTNNVTVALPDGTSSATIGGDIVVKGGSGNYSYRWYSEAGTEFGTEQTLSVNTTGTYLLDIKDTCDCLQTVRFNVGTAGIGELELDAVSITPNPTDGFINIAGMKAVQLTATSMSGRLAALIENDGSEFDSADLGNLAPGHYIVALTDRNGKVFVTKLIKK